MRRLNLSLWRSSRLVHRLPQQITWRRGCLDFQELSLLLMLLWPLCENALRTGPGCCKMFSFLLNIFIIFHHMKNKVTFALTTFSCQRRNKHLNQQDENLLECAVLPQPGQWQQLSVASYHINATLFPHVFQMHSSQLSEQWWKDIHHHHTLRWPQQVKWDSMVKTCFFVFVSYSFSWRRDTAQQTTTNCQMLQ